MANSYWAIFSFLFIFGLVLQTMNEAGIFKTQVPEPGMSSIGNDTAQSMATGAQSQSVDYFTEYNLFFGMLRVIFVASLMACGIVLPFLLMWGFPPMFAVLIQAVIAFYAIPWVFELVTGRPVET